MTSVVEAQVLELLAVGLTVAREVDEVADEHGELLELGARGGERRRALLGRQVAGAGEQLDVRPDRRQRRAQLVRCVGDELALGLLGGLERGQHRVERIRQAVQLVAGAAGGDAPAEVAGLRDVLGGLGQAAHRRHRAARDEQPETAAGGDAGHDHEHEDEPQLEQLVVDLGERARHDHGVAAGVARREDADVGAANVLVGEERRLLARRDQARIPMTQV